MKLLLIALAVLPLKSFACWSECPQGKECYFEEEWLTGDELEKMARGEDKGNCNEGESKTEAFSTGGTYVYTCVNGSLRVKQTTPISWRKERDKTN